MTTEELLNKLISMWRKPWGNENIKRFDSIRRDIQDYVYADYWDYRDKYWSCWHNYSLNDLCSIDSGLRQFVVEKWLYNREAIEFYTWVLPWDVQKSQQEYRIMLSSIQEDKAKFILEFIKWEWKQ